MTLLEILNAKEGHHFEFKEAKNHFGTKEAAEYLCALSNHGGGRLVLGVTDKRPRKAVGSKAFVQFDGTAWWRDGERLVPMPESVRRAIYAEGGHDFTGETCLELTLDDLDLDAIEIFRIKWLEYSGNKRIATLSTLQLLRDAGVVNDDGITYAALILFGKRAPLLKYLSTAEVCYEYRLTETSGPAGVREDFRMGFFNFFDRIWELVNQRNENQHYQRRFQMLPVITFNEVVVREALLNAVSHRDYQLKGSIFVRQFGRKIVVESPGGFPPGITIENILNRHQARNGLIAAVFQLCGLVERSGQGMNLIYERAVREAKPLPTFEGSDSMFVRLTLDCKIIHPKMLALLKEIGEDRLDVMTTEDYLLLSALYRAEDMRGTPPERFSHLEELGIVKYSEHGTGPAKGCAKLFIGSLSEVASDKLPINGSDKCHVVTDYMSEHDFVTTAELAKLLGITQRAALDILKKLIADELVVKSGGKRNAKYALRNDPKESPHEIPTPSRPAYRQT